MAGRALINRLTGGVVVSSDEWDLLGLVGHVFVCIYSYEMIITDAVIF